MFRPARYEQLEPRLLMAADAPPSGMISGRVFLIDEPHAQTPLADVSLTLRDEVGAAVATAATDAAGIYVFDDLAPGLYAVEQIQPTGLSDQGVALGDGGGQQLAPNLIGEIFVAAGSRYAGYHFYEGPLSEAKPDEAPPVIAHGGSDGPNAFWQLQLPTPMPAGSAVGQTTGLHSPASPASTDASIGDALPAVPAPAANAADLATRNARRQLADDQDLLETVVSAAKTELLLDGAVRAARWLESVWDDFSTWLPAEPPSPESAPAATDHAPLVARESPASDSTTPQAETSPLGVAAEATPGGKADQHKEAQLASAGTQSYPRGEAATQ